jgi:hypothetical protein
MIKKIFAIIILLSSVCVGCTLHAEQTYSLVAIDSPFKLPKDFYPYLERPSDKTGDVSDITIKDNVFYFNGDLCGYEIKSLEDFHVDRVLSDAIDDAGGKQKFLTFLKQKLNSNMSKWKQQYFLKPSNNNAENGGCKLLQRGLIYKADNELIIWDTQFFYRFVLGKDFKIGH